MLCPACGSKVNEDDRRCQTCGTLMVHGSKVRGDSTFSKPPANPMLVDISDKGAGSKEILPKEAAAKKAAEEAAARKAAEEAAAKKAAEEAAARRAAEEAARKAEEKRAAEKAAKKAAEETAARRAAEEAAKIAAEEAAKRAAEEAEKRAAVKRAEEEAAKRAAEEAALKRAAAKKAAEEAAAKRAAEEAEKRAAAKRAAEEAAAKRVAEAAAARKAAEETAAVEAAIESAIKTAQETAAKRAAEEAAAEKATEEAAAKKAAMEAAAKKTAGKNGAVSPPQRLSYKIIGGNFPSVSVTLDENQSIFAQSDVMVWMSQGIAVETNRERSSPLFTAAYESHEYGQEISIAGRFPGEIQVLNIGGGAVIVRKEAFLAAQPSVVLSAHVSMNLGSEHDASISFQRLSGAGMAFIAIGGSLIERVLAPGETIKADTANIAAFEESVSFQTQIISDFQNTVFGEGLFLATLTGPGKVWLQTLPAHV